MRKLKRFAAGIMTAVMSFTLAFGMTPVKQTKADVPTGKVYYGFNEITNAGSLVEGTNYLLLAKKYGANEAIAAIPNGSANVRIDSSYSASSYGSTDFYDLSNASGKGVFVNQSGTGFDGCPGGAIVYLTSGKYGNVNCAANPGWYYGCNGGGVSFVGAFYTYSYKEGTYTTDDITITMSDSFGTPSRRTTVSSTDLKVTIKVRETGDVLEIPYFTFADAVVDPDNGDYDITVDVGGVTKSASIHVKESTPSGDVNESERKIGGLVPGATYVVAAGGATEEVIADANGCIPGEKYSGSQITITRKSQSEDYSQDSEPQVIDVPRYKAPTPDGIISGEEISGFKPNARYEILVDGEKTEVVADEDGNINLEEYSNKKITIIKKSENEYEDDSEPFILTVPKYKEAVPSAAVDSDSRIIKGLVPGAEYNVTVDDITKTITADADGNIDASGYSGKQITIVRKALDDNKDDSDAQTIQVPRYKQEKPRPVVDSKNGVIKGLIPNGSYVVTVDGKEKEVIADEYGTIPLAPYIGKTISISNEGDADSNIDNSLGVDLNIKDVHAGEVQKKVKKAEKAPETTINNSVQDILKNILLTSELEKVNGGADAEVWLTVTDITGSVSKDDVAKITGKLRSEEFIGAYVDLSLYKRIGENSPVQIIELSSGKLSVSFKIPESLLAAKGYERDYTIYRLHGDKVEQLTTEYNKETQTITFETDKFSVYAIAYTEKQVDTPKVDAPKTDSPKTGDNSPLMAMLLVMIASSVAIYKLRKEKNL